MTTPYGAAHDVEARRAELERDGYGAALVAAGTEGLDEVTQLALAGYRDARVREALATNSAIGAAAQLRLAEDVDPGVRGSLGFNKHLCHEALGRLVADADEWVRECVVKLQRLPVEACVTLSYDRSEQIVWALAMNPGLPLHDREYDAADIGRYSARLVAEVPAAIRRAAEVHQVRADVLQGLAAEWEGPFSTLLEAARSL